MQPLPGMSPKPIFLGLTIWVIAAQSAVALNFQAGLEPTPKVVVRRFDREILLTWLEDHEMLESYSLGGYKFQGYRVYQGASLTGSFTAIATFDLVDGIQTIFDFVYDEGAGRIIEKPVILADDVGVQRYISIKTDQLFNPGQSLSNYRDYYFAVTAYFINLASTPKVKETSLQTFRAAPSAPDYDVSIVTKTGTKGNITCDKGRGDGEFFYEVIDPILIRSATYRITWNQDSAPESGSYTWNLDRNGVRVLSNQRQTGRHPEGYPRRDAPIVDGLQIQILPASFRAPAKILNSKQTVDVNPNDNGLRLWGGGSVFGPADDLNCSFWGDCSSEAKAGQLQADLEFRFTGVRISERANDTTIVSGGQLGIIRSRNSDTARALVRLPFELWDIENNLQINVFVTDYNADGKSPWGNGGIPQYYRIRGRNYITPIHTPYDEATLTASSFERTDSNATWILFFHSGGQQPASEWSTGDRFGVRFANLTTPGVDEYAFTTTPAIITGQIEVAKRQLQRINIVPNPYWAHNPMERDSFNRFVRITNLPGYGAKIRIFNLAGDLVRVITEQDRQQGTAGLQYVEWDLRNDMGFPVASGVYLVHVEVPSVGNIVKKAVIVMPANSLDFF